MATGFCPSNCTDVVLSNNPTGDCPNTGFRKLTPSRVVFALCNVTLPNPYTNANTAPLLTSGQISFSSPLANFQLADPEQQDVLISDCMPALKVTTKRSFTAEDRIKIELKDGEGVVTDAYFDYKYWKNKKQNKLLLRFGIMMCNGDVYWAKDENGNLIEGSFNAFVSFLNLGEGLGTIELKKIEVSVQGDFLDFNEPDFNAYQLGLAIG